MCAGKGILAQVENFGHVAECGCGAVHVTVGPVTVALDSNALRRLHELLGEAIDRQEASWAEPTVSASAPDSAHFGASHLALKKGLKIKH